MPTDPATLASRLGREMGSWKSIDLRLEIEHTNITGHGREVYAEAVYREHYIETMIGQRLDESFAIPKGEQAQLDKSYCDGTRCATESFSPGDEPRQAHIQIQRAFLMEEQFEGSGRPSPLLAFYAGDVPLGKMLPRAVAMGRVRHLGRDCESYALPDFVWGGEPTPLTIWIDREAAIPVKVIHYGNPEAFKANKPSLIWEAESIDQVEGHWFPLRSTDLMLARSFQKYAPVAFAKYDPETVIVTRKIAVKELHFNRDYPASMFWPVPQAGTSVYNAITGKHVASRQDGKAISEPKKPSESYTGTAVPPSDWTPALSWVGIGLGTALLAAAVLLKRRG